ncbi:MAG: hypothetical protein ACRDPC_21925 [Solirubrobacteraceae bacterium]
MSSRPICTSAGLTAWLRPPSLGAGAIVAIVVALIWGGDVARASHDVSLSSSSPTLTASPTTSGVCLPQSLSFGAAPVSATISASGETDCWRVTGTAGDRVRARVVATSGTLSPRAEVAATGCTAGDDVTCVLTDTSHTIRVRDGAGTGTGGYTISVQRLNAPVGCSSLTYGPGTRTGAIVSGETECWNFTGAAGDRVRLRVVTAATALDPRAELLRSDGTTRCAPTAADDHTCTLDAGGTHTILVRDDGASTGGYSLSVQRLNSPVGCSWKAFGTTATAASLATTGETDCWRLSGAAGDRVRVRVTKSSGALDPKTEVLRPDGTTRCSPTRDDDLSCVLDRTGTHTILVRDSAGTFTGGYRLGLQRLNDPVGCSSLSYGTGAATGSLATTAETDCWRFTAGSANRVRLRVIATTGAWTPIAEIVDGWGTTRCGPASGNELTCELQSAQLHTILVRDSAGTRTGDYRISIQRLNDPVGCGEAPEGAAGEGWVPVAAIDCWRVDGDAGDPLRVRVIDTGWSWDPVTEVVRPDGTTVCHITRADSFTCELDRDGVHTILVRDRSGASYGGYGIAAIRLNDPYYTCPSIVTSASAHTASILGTAEIDCYTSWAPEAGARTIRVEATSGMIEPVVEVLRPDGTPRCLRTSPDGWFDCYGDTYEYLRILVYDAAGTNSGNYEIDLR